MTRVGVDMIEIGRIREALERHSGFRDRLAMSSSYQDTRKNLAQHWPLRFAGKEAVGKASASASPGCSPGATSRSRAGRSCP